MSRKKNLGNLLLRRPSYLWIFSRNFLTEFLFLILQKTYTIQHDHIGGNVNLMAHSGVGLWLSLTNSTTICLYHTETFTHLQVRIPKFSFLFILHKIFRVFCRIRWSKELPARLNLFSMKFQYVTPYDHVFNKKKIKDLVTWTFLKLSERVVPHLSSSSIIFLQFFQGHLYCI